MGFPIQSSYLYFIGYKKAPEWLVLDFILSYLGKKVSDSQKYYREFVNVMIVQEYKSPLNDVVNSTILGSVDFTKGIKDKYLKDKKGDRNLPALRAFSSRPTIESIEKGVELILGADNPLSKKVKLYFCHRYSGQKLREIGTYFDVGESGVSQASRRICLKISIDKKLRKEIMLIEKRLNVSKVWP